VTTVTTTQELDLYQPEKFQVLTGSGNAGFCTAWNQPHTLLARAPELAEKAALIGTLYSSQGVNIIVRNLARNPHITKLYLWGHGTLSNTKFGTVGQEVLKKLWSDGISEDGVISDTPFKLEKEIDRAALDKVREHVELIDVSGQDLSDAVDAISAPSKPYMEPAVFADAELEEPDTFPSEQVGWTVRGRTVTETWSRVVERIMRYGTVKGTQYGSQQKELIGVTWVVTDEDPAKPSLPKEWPASLREVVGATNEAISEYHDVFMKPDAPDGVAYTYGNRLMSYPVKDGTLDQVTQSIVKNLQASPDSRRAVATTLVPSIDAFSDEPPCLTQIQTLQSDGKLHLLATFRSHDIFKAAIPNAFGLRTLQASITERTGFELGSLQITSQSAHIYEADWDNAGKLSACSFWERPLQKLQEGDADPRGVCVIRVENGEIALDFNGRDGQPLIQFREKSADRIVLQLSKHELLSQSGHALDIGIQLARAELAIKTGKPFTQDRPLPL